MKNNSLKILALLVLITMFTSCKKIRNQIVTIERDCTGTYLRLDGKDYKICNFEKVSSFLDGATVTATFKKIKKCNGSVEYEIVCAMMHPNEGWIEKIK